MVHRLLLALLVTTALSFSGARSLWLHLCDMHGAMAESCACDDDHGEGLDIAHAKDDCCEVKACAADDVFSPPDAKRVDREGPPLLAALPPEPLVPTPPVTRRLASSAPRGPPPPLPPTPVYIRNCSWLI